MIATNDADALKAIRAKKAEHDAKYPFGKFGTPRPLGEGPIPRVIDTVDRVKLNGVTYHPTAKRFKIRVNPGRKVAVTGIPFPVRYVAANSADDAVSEYRRATGFDEKLAMASKHYDEPLTESVEFVVTEQPD